MTYDDYSYTLFSGRIKSHEESSSLVTLMNRVQDAFALSKGSSTNLSIDLPQIVVIGSQSSGKSSVLEALVGRDFLPRGNNIVTRRPLILQLVHCRDSQEEYGEFLHQPKKRYYDYRMIRQEIEAETERSCGAGTMAISSEPIRLRISSPHVLTMTLVDLPGMTRVPVGDQPVDIEKQIRRMILKYISAPSSIILAVSPANQDLASSDALDLAKRADPEGQRTIGVLTKLDIMDKGTDAVQVLKNAVVPLSLGYVGVVLRSQHDIVNSTSMQHSREAERIYFKKHSEYDCVAHCVTVGVLARKLNEILAQTIRDALPSLRQGLEKSLEEKRQESNLYGSPVQNKGALLLSIIDAYAGRFAEVLQGNSKMCDQVAGGARIRHIFLNIFNPALDKLDPAGELTSEEIRTAIKNAGGITGSLMIPEAPFELLVQRAIEKLLRPALQCREFVHEELIKVARQCAPPDVSRFPKLQACMMDAVEDFIAIGASPAEAMIRNMIDCEVAFINTSHPSFIGGNEAIAQVIQSRGKNEPAPSKSPPKKRVGGLGELFGPYNDTSGKEDGEASNTAHLCRPPETLKVPDIATDQEIIQVQVTRVLIQSYFDIVRRNVQDMVPKILMNFMIHHAQRGLQKQLTHVLYREDVLDTIMKERDDIAERRAQCHDSMRTIKKALRVLDGVRYSKAQRPKYNVTCSS